MLTRKSNFEATVKIGTKSDKRTRIWRVTRLVEKHGFEKIVFNTYNLNLQLCSENQIFGPLKIFPTYSQLFILFLYSLGIG